MSRRVAGRGEVVSMSLVPIFAVGERVQAFAGACWSYLVRLTAVAAVVPPVSSLAGRGEALLVPIALAVGGRVQALATACWSYLSLAVFAGRRGEVLASSVPICSLWVGEWGLTCC